MNRILLALVGLALLSGCATPIPKSETIPVFPAKPAASTTVAVVDHRPFILNGAKKEWFEGLFRGGFGIPHSLTRNDEFEEKPFAFYLATKLKESLESAGGKASILDIPKGTSLEKATAEIVKVGRDSGLLVMMFQSRYDVGPVNPEYNYHFDLIVLDRDGRILGRKAFSQFDQGMELSSKYNLFDWMSEIYKKKFDSFLADPEIKSALNAAAR